MTINDTFDPWFRVSLPPLGDLSARQCIQALAGHPLAQDECAQDGLVPPDRFDETAGKFLFYVENQECWQCFIPQKSADEHDPIVRFESCMDLAEDYQIPQTDILPDGSTEVGNFSNFLYLILGNHIALRMDTSPDFADSVNGITFDEQLPPPAYLHNCLGCEFPTGFTPYLSSDTIYIPEWGAAFLNTDAKERFVADLNPPVDAAWG